MVSIIILLLGALLGLSLMKYQQKMAGKEAELSQLSQEMRANDAGESLNELMQQKERERQAALTEATAGTSSVTEAAGGVEAGGSVSSSAAAGTAQPDTTGATAEVQVGDPSAAAVSASASSELASSESATSDQEVPEQSASAQTSSETTVEEEYEDFGPVKISCRGDAFQEEDQMDKSIGYPTRMQEILKANGSDAVVKDYTWDMAGTLSQMRYAGIDEDTVNHYIQKHISEAESAGVTLSAYEQQIRPDLDSVYTERDDKDAIPVICMGYYGGYNGDIQELIEQQAQILYSYDLKPAGNGDYKFLILGVYPNGWQSAEAYDNAMKEEWGNHYVPLNWFLMEPAFSEDGLEEIAGIVCQKLNENGYV